MTWESMVGPLIAGLAPLITLIRRLTMVFGLIPKLDFRVVPDRYYNAKTLNLHVGNKPWRRLGLDIEAGASLPLVDDPDYGTTSKPKPSRACRSLGCPILPLLVILKAHGRYYLS